MAKAPEAPSGNGSLPSGSRDIPNQPKFIPRQVIKFSEILKNHPVIAGGAIIILFLLAIFATT